jgi:membrane protein implicated in regulation of membrane protease activity
MSPRYKKLIGTIFMLLWLAVYALLASAVAVRVLPHAVWYVSFLFYALAGTLWAIPIGLMFPWMVREPKPGNR